MEINIEPLLTCVMCIAEGARINPRCAAIRTLCMGSHLCVQARRLAAGQQLKNLCPATRTTTTTTTTTTEERIDTPQPRHTATADAKPERRPYMTADE